MKRRKNSGSFSFNREHLKVWNPILGSSGQTGLVCMGAHFLCAISKVEWVCACMNECVCTLVCTGGCSSERFMVVLSAMGEGMPKSNTVNRMPSRRKWKAKRDRTGKIFGEMNKEDRDGEIGIKKASERSTEEMREQAQVVEVSFDAIEKCRQHSSSCFSHSNRKALFFFYKPVSCPTESCPLLKPHSESEEPS